MRLYLTALAAISTSALISPALAQSAPLAQCTQIADSTDRLACYDAVAGYINTSAQTAETQAKISETKVEKERRLFGLRFNKPPQTPEEFGKRVVPEKQITEITAEIVDVKFVRDTATRIELSNGQVWRQLSSDSARLRISSRDDKKYSATIKTAAMGSFRMKIEPGGRTIRVKRVE